jgi:AbrB family looped-hinge helix DNA binding protein
VGVKAKLSSKFQLSIPKEVREAHGWKPGQTFVFVSNGHNVMLVPERGIESLFGIAKGANPEGYRDRNDRY